MYRLPAAFAVVLCYACLCVLSVAHREAQSARTRQSEANASVSGVYMGFPSNITFVTPHTPTGLRQLAGKDFFVLFPDGQVRRNLPPGGLDAFNRAQDKKADPLNWGTYTVNPKNIVIHWNTTNHDFIAPREKGGFRYQSDWYARVPQTSERLNGTYRRADLASSDFHITFRPDGTFQENGIVGPYLGLSHFAVPGEGTYRVRNQSLYLDYTDGRSRKVSCLITQAEANQDKPALLLLNTFEMGRSAAIVPRLKNPGGVILAKGDPPLTEAMADAATDYYAWLVDIQLSREQRIRIQKYITAYWTNHNASEIKNVLDALRHKETAMREAQYVQNYIRSNARENVVPLWRKATDDPLSLYLAAIYDTQHPG